jgi:hypothetical protein
VIVFRSDYNINIIFDRFSVLGEFSGSIQSIELLEHHKTMSSFGRLFRITTFGESHGKGVGVIVENVPPGMKLTESDIQPQLSRRRPGQSALTTAVCLLLLRNDFEPDLKYEKISNYFYTP